MLVQDPRQAQFDGMPLNAINTGHTDMVLPPEQMAEPLQAYQRHAVKGLHLSEAPVTRNSPRQRLFDLLWEHCGIDFSHYKTGTITRRIERRLALSRDDNIDAYVDRLARDATALDTLYRDLLIGVTQFFRDAEAFDYLERDVIPHLARSAKTRALRIWVAGCATGEEAYSLAILLREYAERQGEPLAVQIFATDVHQPSLDIASAGLYSEDAVRQIKPERLARYFIAEAGRYRIVPAVRQMIVFARHDLTRGAPFGNVDLITCRNVLIYIQTPSQEHILQRFLYGLRMGGMLILGASESIGSLHTAFTELDRHWKVYRKDRALAPTVEAASLDTRRAKAPHQAARSPQTARSLTSFARQQLYDKLLDAFIPAGILINAEGQWEHAVGDLTPFIPAFRGPNDAAVLNFVHPELRGVLHAAMLHATDERQPVMYEGLSLSTLPLDRRVKLRVTPLDGRETSSSALFVTLEAVPVESPAAGDHRRQASDDDHQAVGLLEQELSHTKAALQSTIEELQTRTEELQTNNEELIASNEELQSSNEELQSINEELHTINAEYQTKNQQLIDLHSDTENLLRSTDIGVIFLDAQGCIRKYTPARDRYHSHPAARYWTPSQQLCDQLRHRSGDIVGSVPTSLSGSGAADSTGSDHDWNRIVDSHSSLCHHDAGG